MSRLTRGGGGIPHRGAPTGLQAGSGEWPRTGSRARRGSWEMVPDATGSRGKPWQASCRQGPQSLAFVKELLLHRGR